MSKNTWRLESALYSKVIKLDLYVKVFGVSGA